MKPHPTLPSVFVRLLRRPWPCLGVLAILLVGAAPRAFPQAAPPQGKMLAEAVEIPMEGKKEIKFTANGTQDGTVLLLRARIQFKKIAGAAHAMKVRLNDLELTPAALATPRPNPVKIGAAKTKPWYHPKLGWFIPYGPTFEIPSSALTIVNLGEDAGGPITPGEFRFDVGSLLKTGENVLEIQHSCPGLASPLAVSATLVK